MSTYFKHTRTESAKVPYSFRCEHGMKDSGQQIADITGPEATHNSNFKVLTLQETEKLEKQAHKNLVQKIHTIHSDATQKHIFSKEFTDTCPHCQKPQSWAVSGMQKNMFETPVILLIVGVIISVITYIYTVYEETGWGIMPTCAVMGVAAVAALLSLLFNMAKISAKKKATSSVTQKNLPDIEWSPVQQLLNER